MAEEFSTTLDDHIDAPSVTAPGDGPADTLDPSEVAISVTPDKAAAAKAGYQTVNAVVKAPDRRGRRRAGDPKDKPAERTETYEVEGPDGEPVTVTRNIETGECKVGAGSSAKASGQSRSDTAKVSAASSTTTSSKG